MANLQDGILSQKKALELGILTETNGKGCNGSRYVSVAINAIHIEKSGFDDIMSDTVKIGIDNYPERAAESVENYVKFLLSEFEYHVDDKDILVIEHQGEPVECEKCDRLSFN